MMMILLWLLLTMMIMKIMEIIRIMRMTSDDNDDDLWWPVRNSNYVLVMIMISSPSMLRSIAVVRERELPTSDTEVAGAESTTGSNPLQVRRLEAANVCDSGNIRRDSGNIWRDSGNIPRDSGNIRRDSGNIRRDSGSNPLQVQRLEAANVYGRSLANSQ